MWREGGKGEERGRVRCGKEGELGAEGKGEGRREGGRVGYRGRGRYMYI